MTRSARGLTVEKDVGWPERSLQVKRATSGPEATVREGGAVGQGGGKRPIRRRGSTRHRVAKKASLVREASLVRKSPGGKEGVG